MAAWERWLADHPGDAEAELGLARALSFAGRLDEAERRYARIAATGQSFEAEKGIARVAGWRGELARSEALWRSLSERAPTDPETWTGLAQVLRWRGRPEAAQDALRRALAAEAGYGDALAQLGWVRAELRPAVEPRVTYATDNEGNRTVVTMATLRARAGARLGTSVTGSWRRVSQRFLEGTVIGAQGLARWTPENGRWWAQATAGLSAQRAEDAAGTETASRARPALGAYALTRAGRRLTVGAGASFAPFDETGPLVQRGATLAEGTADAAVLLARGLDADASVSVGRVARGASEGLRRVTATTTLRRTLGRGWRLEGGARYFGYGDAETIYFFAPARFVLAELGPRYERLADLGWFASGAAYLGSQSLRPQDGEADARLARRADGTLGWRFAPGYEVALAGSFANVASPATGASVAEYRAWAATLRARIRL